jgi:sugar (pentulose or hexulose) kinase
MDCVIGCNVGSQGVKAVLLSVEGQLVGEASAGCAIEYPHPTWAEQSAEVWLTAITQAVGALRASTGVAPDHIRAIGLDAQVDGVVVVDKVLISGEATARYLLTTRPNARLFVVAQNPRIFALDN